MVNALRRPIDDVVGRDTCLLVGRVGTCVDFFENRYKVDASRGTSLRLFPSSKTSTKVSTV